MIYGLYLSANGMLTQGMRADVISNNLANGSTHGFKKDFLSLRQRDPEVLRSGMIGRQTQKNLLAIGGAVEGDQSYSIFEQGPMQKTENPLDLALNGEGFFKISDPGGKNYYTRNGAFTLNAQGVLSSGNGMPVLSADGEPIVIEEGIPSVDKAGRVLVNGAAVAQIGITSVSNLNLLHKVGENLYELTENGTEVESQAQLLSGHLEASSVSPVREMTALIEAQRAYQANSKLIGIQDDTLGKAISQIAT
jgi:flagellar basal-body rod protein FlgF